MGFRVSLQYRRLSSHLAEAGPDLVVLPKHQLHNILSEMAKERIRILLLFTVLGLVIFCCITSLHYAPGFSWTCTSSMTTPNQASSRNVLGKRPQILSVSDSSGRCNCSIVLYSSIPSRDSSHEVEPSLNCSCIQATDHTSVLNHSDCPAKVDLQNPSVKEELKCSSEDTVVKRSMSPTQLQQVLGMHKARLGTTQQHCLGVLWMLASTIPGARTMRRPIMIFSSTLTTPRAPQFATSRGSTSRNGTQTTHKRLASSSSSWTPLTHGHHTQAHCHTGTEDSTT